MEIDKKALKLLATGIVSIPILFIATGRASHLSCEKLEKNYVICQLEQRYIHGLWPTSPQDFRLNQVSIESQTHWDDDGKYYTYETHLHSPGEKHFFHHYGRSKISAEIDQEKLTQLINGPSKLSIQLNRSYWLSDIYLFFIVPVYYLWAYFFR